MRNFEMISPFEAKIRMAVGSLLPLVSLLLFWSRVAAPAGPFSPCTIVQCTFDLLVRVARASAGRRHHVVPYGLALPMRLYCARFMESRWERYHFVA